MGHAERWFHQQFCLAGGKTLSILLIYIFGWFNMKSLVDGQLLPRHLQAAVFWSFAVSGRWALTPGQPWLMWAELLASLPSSSTKCGVRHQSSLAALYF